MLWLFPYRLYMTTFSVRVYFGFRSLQSYKFFHMIQLVMESSFYENPLYQDVQTMELHALHRDDHRLPLGKEVECNKVWLDLAFSFCLRLHNCFMPFSQSLCLKKIIITVLKSLASYIYQYYLCWSKLSLVSYKHCLIGAKEEFLRNSVISLLIFGDLWAAGDVRYISCCLRGLCQSRFATNRTTKLSFSQGSIIDWFSRLRVIG